jgi:hypothetical protein
MTREEKLKEIKEHPERHRHTFDGLQACCFHGGALDLQLMEAHETHASLGTNGGRRCDVTRGPCSCGAWHR